MTQRVRARWRARVGAAAVAAVAIAVVALALGVGAAPARLAAAEPADGAVLDRPPAQLSLTFTAPPDLGRSHVGVATADGVRGPAGPLALAGTTLRLPVSLADPGTYVVAYHVVLADGHELTGTTRFVVAAGGPAAPGSAGELAGVGHEHGGVDPLSLAVIGLDAALIVVLVSVLLRRRPPSGPGGDAVRTARDAAASRPRRR